jgi:hypothetical protein
MDTEGGIELRLRAAQTDGTIIEGSLYYPQTDANYQTIIDHIGPIEPGQTVNVLPFE